MGRSIAAFIVTLLLASTASAQPAAALQFWHDCVTAVEAGIRVSGAGAVRASPVTPGAPPAACVPPDGVSATVQDWRGAVYVPHTTVDRLLDSLARDLPRQDDVLAAAFLPAVPPSVKVYLRLVRRKMITVVYDTEHEMTFDRASPGVAFSRSVMTRVAEVDDAGTSRERVRGNDRGFLWKLNAYSMYTQEGTGVWVRMESLSLSRGIPTLLRPIAGPIIDSIARESMSRTLEGLRFRGTGS